MRERKRQQRDEWQHQAEGECTADEHQRKQDQQLEHDVLRDSGNA